MKTTKRKECKNTVSRVNREILLLLKHKTLSASDCGLAKD